MQTMSDVSYIIDTLYILFAMTLVVFMYPGFAMLESGIVRTKNVTSVLVINILIFCVASLGFVLIGYSLAFDTGLNSEAINYATVLFQMAFVGKAMNIMSGGISERAKIIPIALFTLIMATILYPLVVNITWGANFLKQTIFDISPMHDLAGSTIIHSTGGWALLAALLVIGAREGRYTDDGTIKIIPASNIPLVTLGALLLWIGWFGFNGGSVGTIASIDDAHLVSLVILNTNIAGFAGAISVAIVMYIMYKRFDITMILNGGLGGLVSITAGADVLGIYSSVIVGAFGGVLVVVGVFMFDKLKIDDPVGALSVHLLNGIWGTLAVAIFAKDILVLNQLKGILFIGVFIFTLSYALLFILNKIAPIRALKDVELQGLDVKECGLEAYPEFKRVF